MSGGGPRRPRSRVASHLAAQPGPRSRAGSAHRFSRSQGIRAASFKGPVAAVAYYGDLGLRSFFDIDILVPEASPRGLATPLRSRIRAKVSSECGLGGPGIRRGSEKGSPPRRVGAARRPPLGLWSPGYTFAPSSDGPWAAREAVKVGSTEIETLGAEAMALFFCIHGGKHSWFSLKWVCDLAVLLRCRPGLDWKVVLDWSASPGRRRLVDLGLHLAHARQAPVPSDVLARGSAIPPSPPWRRRPLRESFGSTPPRPRYGAKSRTLCSTGQWSKRGIASGTCTTRSSRPRPTTGNSSHCRPPLRLSTTACARCD